jgi:hypothetical protein
MTGFVAIGYGLYGAVHTSLSHLGRLCRQPWLRILAYALLSLLPLAQASAADTIEVALVQPLSKKATGNARYEYAYRIALRNPGVPAYDISARLVGLDKSVQLLQDKVRLDLLPANGQENAEGTIRLRADAGFDTRFDSHGNPAKGYKIDGARINGKDFRWVIDARRDAEPPQVFSTKPATSTNETRPKIMARFKDEGAGIDEQKLTLRVDGKDVTKQAQIDDSWLSYRSAAPLAAGRHEVRLSVQDRLGNRNDTDWSFNIGTVVALPQLMIVHYQPVSKTLVAGSPKHAPLYDYTYRVDVRNSGASAHDVLGVVASKRRSVAVTDPEVRFGDVPAKSIKTSADTFVVRADRYFDRRLDRRVARDGKMVFEEEGEDREDAFVAGLGLGVSRLAEAVYDAYYFLKFSHLFDWKLQSRSDASAPLIEATAPVGNVAQARPAISARYSDGSGIAIGQVRLSLDGADITGSATIGSTNLSYQPASALAEGAHQVTLVVPDTAGNQASANWSFFIDTRAPVIQGQSPAETTSASPASLISARYADEGIGLSLDKIRLSVDGIDVTALASIAADGISYQPAQRLADGNHTAQLRVEDAAGNSTVRSWSFGVDGDGPIVTDPQPLHGAVLPADWAPLVRASYADADAGVDPSSVRLEIDGVDRTGQASISVDGIVFGPAQTLPEGRHQVRLSLSDKHGNPATVEWQFVTQTLPVITEVSPKDVTVNAGSAVTITARYSDVGIGIDVPAVKLTLDGVDVTAQAEVTANALTLAPASPLPQGLHVLVLTVVDRAGNATATSWRFTIDTGLPQISAQAPADILVTSAQPEISASYQDSGASDSATGIDPAKVRLLVDGIDVTSGAQVGATAIRYTPSQPLAAGAHSVKLTVADKAGNSVVSEWGFSVDSSGPAITNVAPADGTVFGAAAAPLLRADFADPGAGINGGSIVVHLDGTDITALVKPGTAGFSYQPAEPLKEGSHVLEISVKDLAGNASTHRSVFKTISAPEIHDIQPVAGVVIPSGSAVNIAASWRDVGAGIDPASARLTVDGVDVTAQASVSDGGIKYTSGTTQTGTHPVVLSVADKAGNAVTANWSFEIDTPAATSIQSLAPANFSSLTPGAAPIISASYADASGIDLTRVRVHFNDVDVTAQATLDASGFRYQVPAPLQAGRHVVYLKVANKQGREATAFWSFDVEPEAAYFIHFLEPQNGAGSPAQRTQVKVLASSEKADVTGITLGGKPMRYLSASGKEVTYVVDVDLVPGDNVLQAEAQFSDKRSKAASITVNFGVPPVVTITSPADRTTLGPVGDSSPLNLTGNVERPLTITGTTSKPVQSVTINQQQAVVSGTTFRFEKFFLHEGLNMLTAVATDDQGRVGTASIAVAVDQTAPILGVEAPLHNSITSANAIDVRGTVNDAVEGYYGAPEPVVTVSGLKGSVTAVVGDKQFLAASLPLELGENQITVTARDQVNNLRTTKFTVLRVAGGSDRLTLSGGNGQSAVVGSALPQALSVAAIGRDGKPLANVPVTFDVARGTGALARSQQDQAAGTTARNLVINTDANGLASVWMTVGKQSGPGSNAVRASSASLAEAVTFIASGEKGAPKFIRADLGINQYAAVGTLPMEPLTAVLVDDKENRIAQAEVSFKVVAGEARFDNGSDSVTVRTDKNGFAAVRPTILASGTTIITATPAAQAEAFFEAVFTVQGLEAGNGPTAFSGIVTNDKGQPLPGARMSIGRTALSATADDQGRFSFEDVPPGKIDLFVDGRTVNVAGQQYPALHFEATAVKGVKNQLPHPIYLPQLNLAESKIVGGNEDVVLKMPGFEGYEMTVFANSVTFPDGSKVGPLVVSPIGLDKLPMTPPGGYAGFMAPAATIQPSGTRFDPPVQLRVPNTAGLLPGEKKPVYQWDHDLATFVPMGQATVSEDGAFLVTDAGTGVSKAGWHPIPNPPPPEDCPSSGGAPTCTCKECDCQREASTGGQCPKKYCEREKTDGNSCDDKKYCTEKDVCKGTSCSGTPIPDKEGPANVVESNLATFNHVFRVLSALGVSATIDTLKVSLTMQEREICCESKQGAMTKGGQGKLEGQASVNVGPVQIVGWKLPFPSIVTGKLAGLQIGGFVSAGIGGAVNASGKYAICEGYEGCWGGGGNMFLEATGEVGLILKDGPIVAARLTGGVKSGYQAGIDVSCTSGTVHGIFWPGVTGQVVLEFNDGQIHVERQWVLVEGQHLAPFGFSVPPLGQ